MVVSVVLGCSSPGVVSFLSLVSGGSGSSVVSSGVGGSSVGVANGSV